MNLSWLYASSFSTKWLSERFAQVQTLLWNGYWMCPPQMPLSPRAASLDPVRVISWIHWLMQNHWRWIGQACQETFPPAGKMCCKCTWHKGCDPWLLPRLSTSTPASLSGVKTWYPGEDITRDIRDCWLWHHEHGATVHRRWEDQWCAYSNDLLALSHHFFQSHSPATCLLHTCFPFFLPFLSSPLSLWLRVLAFLATNQTY